MTWIRHSLLAVGVCLPSLLAAQAFSYPSLQTPRASTRDYTAALVGGAGSTVLLQWREGLSTGLHWQVEGGVADPKGRGGARLFGGAGVGKELLRASAEQPLDVMLTAGAGVALGGGTVVRVPVGASVGHTFPLDGDMTLTPYVHPRASLDLCRRCAPEGAGRSTVSLNFDIGALWQVQRAFAVTAAVSFSGSDVLPDHDLLAVGVRWTPVALTGRR